MKKLLFTVSVAALFLATGALLTMICLPQSAMAHRMTGRDIRATGMHHCAWSVATTCKKKTLRRQIPCGNGRYCRW
jgi:hypothetical protein